MRGRRGGDVGKADGRVFLRPHAMTEKKAPEPEARILPGLILWLLVVAFRGLVGALGGAFVLPLFIDFVRKFFDAGRPGMHDRWLLAAILGGINVAAGFAKDGVQARRRRNVRRAAVRLGLAVEDFAGEALEERLEELFAGAGLAVYENVVRKEVEGATCVVGDLSYTEHSPGSESSRTVCQTVACFESGDLALPPFDLRPEGFWLKTFSGLAGIEDIDFPEHPRFSDLYHLSGTRPDRIRRLFDAELLEYFSDRSGFQAIGKRNRLAFFRPGKHLDPDALGEFLEQAEEVFRRFRKASRKGLESTPSKRARPPEDPEAALARLPNLVRWSFRARLVAPPMLDAFLAAPPPREVPRQIKAQHLGSGTLVPAAVGSMFTLGGGLLLLFGVLLASGPWYPERFFLTVLSSVFVVIGFPLGFFSIRYRWWNMRVLRQGVVAPGFLEEVVDTGTSVDGWKRYRARIRFEAGGAERMQNTFFYGDIVREARRCVEEKRPVRILYDPRNPKRAIWAGSIITAIPECE